MGDSKRAMIFADGNNWYHSLRSHNVAHRGDLDYGKVSRKIIGARTWVGTRYYIGVMPQDHDREQYEGQRRFLARLEKTDRLISIHRGRLEPRRPENKPGVELRQYLAGAKSNLPPEVWNDLMDFALRCDRAKVLVEKAVDVQLAIDMMTMALEDRYDHAYLLSADGDFTPAIQAVQARGKFVYAASLEMSYHLKQTAHHFLHLKPEWLSDCYLDPTEKTTKGPSRAFTRSAASAPPTVIKRRTPSA